MADLVSIVVIAYNSEETIRETLESCYAQDYSNIEIIVADDGSSDATVNVANNIAQCHPNVHTVILASARNYGITRNCKSGLDAARGVWAKVIGADDILLSTAISSLTSGGNRAEADVVFSQFESFGSENRLYPRPWTLRGIRSRRIDKAMLMGFGVVAPGAMVRLDTLRSQNLPSLETVMAEDSMFYDLAVRGCRFTFVEEVTVMFRVHHKQITAGETPAAKLLKLEQERFFKQEVVGRLGLRHPYVLHVRYQKLVDRVLRRLPYRFTTLMRLLDPVFLLTTHVDRNFPWQRDG